MKRELSFGITLLLCATAEAADPPAGAKAQPVSVTAASPAPAAVQAPPRKTLDLRVGDIRKYMTPEEYRALSAAPEANTVIVQANAPLLPMKSEQPIPSGMPLLPLWWAVTHPSQSWRILVPDLNAPASGPPDKIPPPIFRRGP